MLCVEGTGFIPYPRPVFKDAFIKLDKLEVEDLLQHLNPAIDGSPYIAEQTTILSMNLSFYPNCRFLEISDHTTLPARKTSLILRDAGVVVLDWTNGPIYKLNENVPIQLNENNVIEYVRFFFAFVRGRHGRFLIIETVDDIAWKDEPPPNARKAIGGLIEPISISKIDDEGTFHLSVRMMFKDSLMKAKLRVTSNGIITMDEEELVVEDIPVLDDITG